MVEKSGASRFEVTSGEVKQGEASHEQRISPIWDGGWGKKTYMNVQKKAHLYIYCIYIQISGNLFM